MPSKAARLPTTFGAFSKLPPDRLHQIRQSAKAAARAYQAGDKRLWEDIIRIANNSLSNHETGVFSAFALAEISNG